MDIKKKAAGARAQKSDQNGRASTVPLKTKSVAVARMRRPKWATTPASSQVGIDHCRPTLVSHAFTNSDSVAFCFPGLPGQASVAEDIHNINWKWKALYGSGDQKSSGSLSPILHSLWKDHAFCRKICVNLGSNQKADTQNCRKNAQVFEKITTDMSGAFLRPSRPELLRRQISTRVKKKQKFVGHEHSSPK